MRVKITDQYTGHDGVYEVATLAESQTNLSTTPAEAQAWIEAQAALQAEDWSKVADLSALLKFDIEVV